MKLSQNWLTEGLIDLEYKQYLVLAYLKHVKEKFDQEKLYPALGELVYHHQNLLDFQSKKIDTEQQLKKVIATVNLSKMKLGYKKTAQEDILIKEIESIINFTIPKFEKHLEKGKEIYETVEANMEIQPLGVQPKEINDGFVFIKRKTSNKIRIYQYTIRAFYNLGEKYKGLNFEFIKEKKQSLGETLEQIKIGLIRQQQYLQTPATYLIEHALSGSYWGTTFPIAQRLLIKHVNAKV